MITDDERREVARSLQECKSHIDAAGWFWLNDELGGAHIVASSEERLRRGTALLADLIEPDEPKVRCVAEVKVDGEQLEKLVHDAVVKLTGIDRDALVALADEINNTSCDNHGELSVSLGDIWGWAQAIREALGVES